MVQRDVEHPNEQCSESVSVSILSCPYHLWPIFAQMKVSSQTLLLLAHIHCKPTQSTRILARCGY